MFAFSFAFVPATRPSLRQRRVIRLRGARTVDQFDFGDFVATSDFNLGGEVAKLNMTDSTANARLAVARLVLIAAKTVLMSLRATSATLSLSRYGCAGVFQLRMYSARRRRRGGKHP